MKGVKYIEISTENCELFRFTRVGNFALEDITRQIQRMGCNFIGEYSVCKQAVIHIFAEDNRQDCNVSGYAKENLFERIKRYGDITSIGVVYEDDSEEEIYVEYEEADDNLGAPNINQDCYINQFGDLFIAIGPKKIKDLFSEEALEDKPYREFMRDMYDELGGKDELEVEGQD